MGLFDRLFSGKPTTGVDVVDDIIWLDTEAKFAAVACEVDERLKSG